MQYMNACVLLLLKLGVLVLAILIITPQSIAIFLMS